MSQDTNTTERILFLAEQSGLSVELVRRYHSTGLLANELGDAESLLRLLRTQHLHQRYQLSLDALKLVSGLMDEVAQLRTLLRSTRC